MKKNKMMRIASVLLIAVLMTTCAISGTFAKYVTEVEAAATATIAKWSITVQDQDVVVDNSTVEFELDATVTEYDGSTEEDVAAGLLAPGTAGSFSFTIANTSEVTAAYTITFEEGFNTLPNGVTEETFPVEYSVTGTDGWTTVLEDLEVSSDNLAMDAEDTVVIYWRWAFLDTDEANAIDTALGTAATEVTITASIIVEQVD